MSEQEKKQNTVAEVLVKCLENEGVKYVFGIPGEENLDMMNALEKSDIRVIVVRHEQGAAFMADMYGRLTGKAGVCFSTLGPGATNSTQTKTKFSTMPTTKALFRWSTGR